MVKKADGGVAGLLGERTGFQVGGASIANYTPQPRPSGLASFDKIHPDFKTGQPMAQLPGITPRPGSLGPVTGGGQPFYGQPGGFANLDSAVQPNMSRPLNFFNVDITNSILLKIDPNSLPFKSLETLTVASIPEKYIYLYIDFAKKL